MMNQISKKFGIRHVLMLLALMFVAQFHSLGKVSPDEIISGEAGIERIGEVISQDQVLTGLGTAGFALLMVYVGLGFGGVQRDK